MAVLLTRCQKFLCKFFAQTTGRACDDCNLGATLHFLSPDRTIAGISKIVYKIVQKISKKWSTKLSKKLSKKLLSKLSTKYFGKFSPLLIALLPEFQKWSTKLSKKCPQNVHKMSTKMSTIMFTKVSTKYFGVQDTNTCHGIFLSFCVLIIF